MAEDRTKLGIRAGSWTKITVNGKSVLLMRLSLIGMSGSGKSSWSIHLAEAGFAKFCCDDMITKKLCTELARPDGTAMELGGWMGFPFDASYKERESRYLAYEIEVMEEILDYLESKESHWRQNIVVDTTGSVIYTGENVLARLRRSTTVVHLATPPEVHKLMLKAYLTNMRPVLWRDLFSNIPDEPNEDALARCYPKLLSTRERLYEQHAEITIDYYTLNQKGFGVKDLLNAVDTG